MRFYSIEGIGNYAGGVVLIAAETEREALVLANGGSDNTYGIKYLKRDLTEIEGLAVTDARNNSKVILRYELGE